MSGDEIVFGEVSYREPVRARRPDRDRALACVAYEVPGAGDLPIYLDRGPADAIERHALRDTSVELGGILLGRECLDDQTGEPFVWVTQSLEAKHYENTQASFTYTHDSWQEITRERDAKYPDLDVVGWYHTHPDFGIFLSSHDLFIHRNFFDQPLQVAYVVDPIRQARGFFRWRDGGLEQVGGFTLTADRSERQALARLANDLESIPNAEAGGSGLSPRLEAELIAMLSRPSHAHAHAHAPVADRAATAALGSLAGLLIGVLGFAAVLWINGLGTQVRDQAETIRGLDRSVKENTETQRLALDALGHKGEADPFNAAYREAVARRDGYRAKSESLAHLTEKLGAENLALLDEAKVAARKVAEAEALAREYASEAKEAKGLRSSLAEAKGQIDRQAASLKTKSELLDATDESKAAALLTRARWATYLAVAGWVAALGLGVGLVVLWSIGNQSLPAEPDRTGEKPPHVIM